MKKFAFYLPQFHEISENNKWWGDGFTEWTNVKKAKPLYKGHKQPKEPLNDNYYNLLDIETVKWQTNLMKEHGIDGLIYYHYYFNGKLLLEKPAENLLKNKDIDQKFFFCWANHSWIKSWQGSKEILIEQTYGNEDDWEKHFQYLLAFFKDERYEKKDNMPLFMTFSYRSEIMNGYMKYLNKRCIDEGFNGLYVIRTCEFGYYDWPIHFNQSVNSDLDIVKKVFVREANVALDIYNTKLKYKPIKIYKKITRSLKHLVNKNVPSTYNGNILYNIIYKYEPISDRLIRGLFFEWDNTSRHGNRGYVISPPSKKMFTKVMNKFKDEEYVFFNAWNEWAEGMMLEPTKENGYKYLEWIKEINDEQ